VKAVGVSLEDSGTLEMESRAGGKKLELLRPSPESTESLLMEGSLLTVLR
jgi:hypothetical protein